MRPDAFELWDCTLARKAETCDSPELAFIIYHYCFSLVRVRALRFLLLAASEKKLTQTKLAHLRDDGR